MASTFSSKQYKWPDLSVVVGGRILEGITVVEYAEKREKDFLYGRGSKPHRVVSGNASYEGKISIWQSELEAMTRDAPNNDILLLEMEIIIAYVPSDGGQIVTDILKGVEFTEVKKGMTQGDKNMIVELPIIFTDVKRQQ
ncbi:hypothetical protein OMO38_10290 [Chryseobacterium sp. 09-1422]|uniref:Phage tail protein n=1 Tax=Chryseobacterium kimseyorum TaxID=2984028 RepID=A0ABT3HYQ0_9FLAO|nr:hypothetical protein [Chryseobacterium kimseyorum]MCW3168910.1 hypothetical protein [Chryseobacterium kimseyorum]